MDDAGAADLLPRLLRGAWGFCPDPVDFHAFQSIDVYKDGNAYYDQGPFERFPKLLGRLADDHILSTMESFSRQEAVLGTRGRSGGQMDAFHATFGPADADGYPAKLWSAETGTIDPAVAKYWQEHYDLTAKLQREWDRLGIRLVGKTHVTMGTKDTFYLDAASHRMQDFLESTKLPGKGPYYGGTFDFGNNRPHCYAGDIPPGVPMLTYYVRVFADYMPADCGQRLGPLRLALNDTYVANWASVGKTLGDKAGEIAPSNDRESPTSGARYEGGPLCNSRAKWPRLFSVFARFQGHS
jgi:hypothetical protein